MNSHIETTDGGRSQSRHTRGNRQLLAGLLAASSVIAGCGEADVTNSSVSDATTAPTEPVASIQEQDSATSTTIELEGQVALQDIADRRGKAVVYVSDEHGISSAAAGEVDGRPLRVDDVYFIGSGSKMITSAAVLQLVDEGLVGLDDLLADYVEFEVATPITIRHLLQHTSGLSNFGDFYTCDTDEVMAGLAGVAASGSGTPGETAKYSTNGFNMLSLVIASASGRNTAEVIRDNIFDPLGMTSTYFTEAEDGPSSPDAVVVFDGVSDDRPAECPSDELAIGTGGGFASSAADLDTFVRALFDGGLLSDDSLAEMTSIESSVYGIDYGLGVGRVELGLAEREMYGHWGDFGWEAGVLYDPDRHRAVVVIVTGRAFLGVAREAVDWAEGQ